jgi:hypothetical protein
MYAEKYKMLGKLKDLNKRKACLLIRMNIYSKDIVINSNYVNYYYIKYSKNVSSPQIDICILYNFYENLSKIFVIYEKIFKIFAWKGKKH